MSETELRCGCIKGQQLGVNEAGMFGPHVSRYFTAGSVEEVFAAEALSSVSLLSVRPAQSWTSQHYVWL